MTITTEHETSHGFDLLEQWLAWRETSLEPFAAIAID